MTARPRLIFLSTALFLSACARSSDFGSSSSAIQEGQIETGQPNVGLLEFSTGNFGSGTLISPTVVLTAGHVTYGNIQGFYLGQGTPSPAGASFTASSMMRKVEILDKIDHPSYKCMGTDCDQWGTLRLDIGVVRLKEPIYDIAPATLGVLAPSVGSGCTTVGYGEHDVLAGDVPIETDMGALYYWMKQKRSCGVQISSVTYDSINTTLLTGIADDGDSGGPLLCDGNLVGTVASHADGVWPAHIAEQYTRVLPALPWIQQQMALWAVAPPPDLGPDASDVGDASTPIVTADAAVAPADNDSGCSMAPRPVHPALLVLLFPALLLLRRRRTRG